MNETIVHTGAWAIALIVIVLASWLFYRYFSPEGYGKKTSERPCSPGANDDGEP